MGRENNNICSGKSTVKYLLSCAVLFLCINAPARGTATFYKDVQPVLFQNCAYCHRPGQSAPFSLISYNDVTKHASTIKYAISTGYMPPWKADTTYRKFIDQRILSEEEKSLIINWIADGMSEGNHKDEIELPFIDKHSNLGKPDLAMTIPEVFKLQGINRDTVVYFVMHYSIPTDTNVLAFEFEPGNPRAVHHSNTWVFPDSTEYDRFYLRELPGITSLEESQADFPLIDIPFVNAYPVNNLPQNDFPDFFPRVPPLYYDGWVPGTSARTWPEGFGFRLPSKGIIITQIHYGPTPIPLEDQSIVNIFFTGKKADRMIESFNIGSSGGIAEPEPKLVLPPDSIKSFEVTAEVAKDLSYLAINPHMHFLGKEMKSFAITPAGDTIPLVWIKSWDFRWQEFYKPLSLIKIPKGSHIKVFATFDNTESNPSNQFSPPKKVLQGANSTDEMMSLIVMSVEYRAGDENIILKPDLPVIKQVTKK